MIAGARGPDDLVGRRDGGSGDGGSTAHHMQLRSAERPGGATVESSRPPDGPTARCSQYPTVSTGGTRDARRSRLARAGACGSAPGRTVVPLVRDGRCVGSLSLTAAPAHVEVTGRPHGPFAAAPDRGPATAATAVTRVAGLPPTLRRPRQA